MYLTTSQAAATAGVSVDTIRRWVRTNRIKAARTPGGQLRIPAVEVIPPEPSLIGSTATPRPRRPRPVTGDAVRALRAAASTRTA